MKRRVIQALSPIFVLMFAASARAQLDSASAVLLRPSGRSPSPEMMGGRYKIRAPESHKDDDLEETPGTYIASPVPKPKAKKEEKPAPVEAKPDTQPNSVPAPTVAPAAAPVGEAAPAPRDEAQPPITVQVKQLVLGGTDEDISEAKKQIHPEDPRANMISLLLAPAYFYDGSSSNYSFRNYHSDGPGLGLGMNLWLTPFFGLQSRYFTSVTASVRDGANAVPFTQEEFEAGIRFRRHFGYTRTSAQISWGIDYHDSTGKIAADANTVIGHKSAGLSLGVSGMIPTSVTYAHTFEVNIRPSQHQSEMGTGVDPKSGTGADTNSVSLSVGGQWTLDRRDQVFWKTQYSVERNLFNGDATMTDPKTGATPNGVSVTNSLVIFYFGFQWGS